MKSSLRLRQSREFLIPILGLLSLVWARSAHASTSYPRAIADALEAPCAPPCTVCHRDNVGGLTTVVEPFGFAMIANGLGFFTPEKVAPTLDRLAAAATDSDADGTSDVEELAMGRDPNGDLDLCGISASYGCGARVAPTPPGRELSYLGVAGAAAVIALGTRRIWRPFTGRRPRPGRGRVEQ